MQTSALHARRRCAIIRRISGLLLPRESNLDSFRAMHASCRAIPAIRLVAHGREGRGASAEGCGDDAWESRADAESGRVPCRIPSLPVDRKKVYC